MSKGPAQINLVAFSSNSDIYSQKAKIHLNFRKRRITWFSNLEKVLWILVIRIYYKSNSVLTIETKYNVIKILENDVSATTEVAKIYNVEKAIITANKKHDTEY